jgi:hypothetical protein
MELAEVSLDIRKGSLCLYINTSDSLGYPSSLIGAYSVSYPPGFIFFRIFILSDTHHVLSASSFVYMSPLEEQVQHYSLCGIGLLGGPDRRHSVPFVLWLALYGRDYHCSWSVQYGMEGDLWNNVGPRFCGPVADRM